MKSDEPTLDLGTRREEQIIRRKLRMGAAIALVFLVVYYAYFLPLVFGGQAFIIRFGAATTVFLAITVILTGMVGVVIYHFFAIRMERV